MCENGMIVTRLEYDPQERPIDGAVCCVCHEVIQGDVAQFLGGDMVCEDCLNEYLDSKAGDHVDAFVSENRAEYLTDWWYHTLPPADQQEIDRQVRAYWIGLLSERQLKMQKLFPRIERQEAEDFCREREEFREFVRKELS